MRDPLGDLCSFIEAYAHRHPGCSKFELASATADEFQLRRDRSQGATYGSSPLGPVLPSPKPRWRMYFRAAIVSRHAHAEPRPVNPDKASSR